MCDHIQVPGIYNDDHGYCLKAEGVTLVCFLKK
jgi:hypothetical protein